MRHLQATARAASLPLPAAADAQAKAMAATVDAQVLAWRRDLHQHPGLGNREALTARQMADHQRQAEGDANLADMHLNMGAEDFSVDAREVPGLLFVGATPRGQDALRAPSNHAPECFHDEGALKAGTRAMLQILLNHQRGAGA